MNLSNSCVVWSVICGMNLMSACQYKYWKHCILRHMVLSNASWLKRSGSWGSQESNGDTRNTRASRASVYPTMLQIDKLREVFLKYDKDGDARITREEFANLMQTRGQQGQLLRVYRGIFFSTGWFCCSDSLVRLTQIWNVPPPCLGSREL